MRPASILLFLALSLVRPLHALEPQKTIMWDLEHQATTYEGAAQKLIEVAIYRHYTQSSIEDLKKAFNDFDKYLTAQIGDDSSKQAIENRVVESFDCTFRDCQAPIGTLYANYIRTSLGVEFPPQLPERAKEAIRNRNMKTAEADLEALYFIASWNRTQVELESNFIPMSPVLKTMPPPFKESTGYLAAGYAYRMLIQTASEYPGLREKIGFRLKDMRAIERKVELPDGNKMNDVFEKILEDLNSGGHRPPVHPEKAA